MTISDFTLPSFDPISVNILMVGGIACVMGLVTLFIGMLIIKTMWPASGNENSGLSGFTAAINSLVDTLNDLYVNTDEEYSLPRKPPLFSMPRSRAFGGWGMGNDAPLSGLFNEGVLHRRRPLFSTSDSMPEKSGAVLAIPTEGGCGQIGCKSCFVYIPISMSGEMDSLSSLFNV